MEEGGGEECRRRGVRVEERTSVEEKPQGSVWLRGLQDRGAPDPD